MSDHPQPAAPLEGVRVIELAGMYAAPTTGRLLRDFGAEVIKVEDPVSGDGARHWVPQKNGTGIGFTRLNTGKRSVGIDLRTAEGQELVRCLTAQSDVVVESFRPGRLEEWGLGYGDLSERNPRIIMARVSGFGQTGPYRERPGFGTIAEAVSGFAYINGWPDTPPTAPPFGFADSIAGFAAAYGVAMALYRREETGRGELLDVALYEPLMFILGDAVIRWTASQEITEREGNATGAASPRGIYQAADGRWLAIAASAQRIAERLFVAIGRPEMNENPRYATPSARLEHDVEIQEILQTWIGARSRSEAINILERHHVVAAPVNDARDVAEDPHFRERSLRAMHSTTLGDILMPGPVLRAGAYPGPDYRDAPTLGQDTSSVLRDVLELDQGAIDKLRDASVISPH